MRGAVSIALAYNKVNLVFGPSDLSFGLEMLYCFCVLHSFQNVGHFCCPKSNFSNINSLHFFILYYIEVAKLNLASLLRC